MATNPARENRWNAYRWPTEDEVASGRSEWDVFWVGCALTEKEAIMLLPKKEGRPFGQIQWGKGGEVHNL